MFKLLRKVASNTVKAAVDTVLLPVSATKDLVTGDWVDDPKGGHTCRRAHEIGKDLSRIYKALEDECRK